MSVTVTLTWEQIRLASRVGLDRRIMNAQRSIAGKYGATNGDGSWEHDINGCCAEIAVAAYLNLFWCGNVGDYNAVDVGGCIEVRSCAPGRRLLLHDDEKAMRKAHLPHVLAWVATATLPKVDLVGWMIARDGLREEWKKDPTGKRPAFFVPCELPPLRPVEELRRWYAGSAIA